MTKKLPTWNIKSRELNYWYEELGGDLNVLVKSSKIEKKNIDQIKKSNFFQSLKQSISFASVSFDTLFRWHSKITLFKSSSLDFWQLSTRCWLCKTLKFINDQKEIYRKFFWFSNPDLQRLLKDMKYSSLILEIYIDLHANI